MIELIIGSVLFIGVYILYTYSNDKKQEHKKTPFHDNLRLNIKTNR